MEIKKFIILIITTLTLSGYAFSQKNHKSINNQSSVENWEAKWITQTMYNALSGFPAVCLFRKTFDIDQVPDSFLIHASADNRYKLYINGQYIGNGPARSVPAHWQYETYDLAKYLQKGQNVLAAKVWFYGDEFKPWGQTTSGKMGLLVQGNTKTESVVNTSSTWKVITDKAYSFKKVTSDVFYKSTGVGPIEIFDASQHPWGWQTPGFDDSAWQLSSELTPGAPVGVSKVCGSLQLEPRIIPQLEYIKVRGLTLERSNLAQKSIVFDGTSPLVVPPNQQVEILLDNEVLNAGYPNIVTKQGAGSSIKVMYNEALFDSKNQKYHRDSVNGLELKGYYDIFYPDGKPRHFEALWYKTYRYVQLNIETKNEPLVIDDFYFMQSLYPFEKKASFSCSDTMLNQIFETGWRTGRLCAFENYVDCPYYEQLQYFGDQNISNPVTVWLSGDARLMKSTILQAAYSKTPENLTTAASPGSVTMIPFFSITVIGIINNYLNYTADTAFVASQTELIRGILDWYDSKLQNNNLLGPMSHWNFVDCTEAWPWAPDNGTICEPEGTKTGNSSILTLQYVYGLQLAADIFKTLGDLATANKYMQKAETINKAVYQLCWDNQRGYLADTPEKTGFSQHANIFGALTGTFEEQQAKDVLTRVMKDTSLIQATLQYQAYFHKGLVKYNLGNEYTRHLDKWKNLIELGFSTFPEYPDVNTRSDCHAWSAYPAYEMLHIICGIQIARPGFEKVVIKPALGTLQWVNGKMPCKDGYIEVNLKKTDGKLTGNITIPEGISALAEINDKTLDLKPGENVIK